MSCKLCVASRLIVHTFAHRSGKSTQLPSFILEDQLSKGIPCKILVTEPRRISAITLAQRVSQELGEAPQAVGTPSSLVGYAIRLESHTSQSTRLTFCTNGIALRMFESGGQGGTGASVDDVTHIVVDEVSLWAIYRCLSADVAGRRFTKGRLSRTSY